MSEIEDRRSRNAPSNTRVIRQGLQGRKALPKIDDERHGLRCYARGGARIGREQTWCKNRRSRHAPCSCCWPPRRSRLARPIQRSAGHTPARRWRRCAGRSPVPVVARGCRARAGRPNFRFITNGVLVPHAMRQPWNAMRACGWRENAPTNRRRAGSTTHQKGRLEAALSVTLCQRVTGRCDCGRLAP